jgi:alkanesulfonate monooxygenase SsuD/methylene tetrahydromethanopterin reductase-like flavin-dependent oxidoreductase (luciferase family)
MTAVGITPMETRREVILHLATTAEELGYSAFFLAEGWAGDASVQLAEIAVKTSRIQLGTGVLNVWGRSAASIAMLASSLADLSGGRFTLGLGAGSPQLAEGLHDVPFQAPVQRLGAVTRQVRRLLDGQRIEPSIPDGSRPLQLAARSQHDISIQLAALGPNAVRLCGELADGWAPFLLPISALKDRVLLLEEGAARRSDQRLPRICPCLPVAVSADPVQARALASWWIAFYLTSMGPLYRRTLRDAGFGAAVDAVIAGGRPGGTAQLPTAAQPLIEELILSGDGGQARAGLDRWYAAGAEMPVIVLPPQRNVDELTHMLDQLRPI